MISNLKDLEKLLKLCRRQGVTEIKLQDVEFKLGELPTQPGKSLLETEADPADPYADFPTGELSPEQLMFYSAGGSPDEDPHRKD